jgi:hypothetical protein
MVGAHGQPTNAAAAGLHQNRARHHHVNHAGRNHQHSRQSGWGQWCKHHGACRKRYHYVAFANPKARAQAWRKWCLKRPSCVSANPRVRTRYVLAGPTGNVINQRPEGAYVSTFMQAARQYRVDPRVLMGIGMVESGGGVAGTAYMGCMNYATFGSWPGQIYCAAQVLSEYGLGGYNSVNPSYSATVMGQADGIKILSV